MEVGVCNDGVGADEYPVANIDATSAYHGSASKPTIVANPNDCRPRTCGQYHRMIGRQRIGGVPGTQIQSVPNVNATATMPLNDGGTKHAPASPISNAV